MSNERAFQWKLLDHVFGHQTADVGQGDSTGGTFSQFASAGLADDVAIQALNILTLILGY
jgi:hypothetical protein